MMKKKEIINSIKQAIEQLDYIENIYDYDPYAGENGDFYVVQLKAKEIREILSSALK